MWGCSTKFLLDILYRYVLWYVGDSCFTGHHVYMFVTDAVKVMLYSYTDALFICMFDMMFPAVTPYRGVSLHLVNVTVGNT